VIDEHPLQPRRITDGALGSLMATRFATGRKNFLRFELFGSEGSLLFNLEPLNEIQYYTRSEPGREQGFRTILATESDHPYINRWWPPGHIIGWEHTFIHEVGDLLTAIGRISPLLPTSTTDCAISRSSMPCRRRRHKKHGSISQPSLAVEHSLMRRKGGTRQ